MKINLYAETAKGVKSYEQRTKSGGTATTGAFCLNCDLCDFNDLYDSDCRMSIEANNTSQSSVQTSRAASPRRTRDNQNHKNQINYTHHSSILKFQLIIILLLSGGVFTNVSAQVLVGDTAFWFAAPDLMDDYVNDGCQYRDSPMMFLITNGSAHPANVTIRFYNNGSPINATNTIAPNDSWKYDIPGTDRGVIENPRSSAGNVTDYGVHITSDVKVTAYYQVLPPCSQDIFAMKGSAALGTLFYVPMIHDSYYYSHSAATIYDQIDIVAIEDNTTVYIMPTQEIRIGTSSSSPAGTEIIRTLNKGQTLKIMENAPGHSAGTPSLAGTRISANKPIAVTTAEDAVMRSGYTGIDVIGDQIVPVSSLGKRYVVIKGYNNAPERVYMIATANNTAIYVNDGTNTTNSGVLTAGQCWVFDMGNTNTDPHVVTVSANEPFYCYQVTGTGSNELGSALLPSIYSVSQTQLSFYSYEVIPADYNKLLLLFRDGSEGDFTLSYGSVAITPSLTPLAAPGMPEWKAAKYEIPDEARNQVVTIRNTSSMFASGYFSVSTSSGGASFGYLSAFGMETLSFPDTMYKCAGANITLDAGYGEAYDWTLPNGTHLYTSTITVADTGTYSVSVDQAPFTITASTKILNRFDGASLVSSGGNNVGAGTYTYSVDLNRQTVDYVQYVWKVDGVQVSTGATYSVTWTNADEHLITVEVSDASLGCSKTLGTVHHKLPDNINPVQCFITPPSSTWSIAGISSNENDLSPYQHPLVGDMNGDGIPEIFVATDLEEITSNTGDRPAKKIAIYKGNDIEAPPKYITTEKPFIWDSQNRNVLYRTKIDGKDTVLITVVEKDSVLRTYNYDGNVVWRSPKQTRMSRNGNSISPSVVDFNHDGVPEIVIAGHIFNSATGALICSTPGNSTTYVHAVDVFNTGTLNYVQGTAIYDVTIDGSTNAITGLTLNKTLSPPVFSASDPDNPSGTAYTAGVDKICYVDMDNDGQLDCIIQAHVTLSGRRYQVFYIIDPSANTVKARKLFAFDAAVVTVSGSSQHFVGDMDGDGLPEIAFIRGGLPSPYYNMEIVAMKYDPQAAFVNRLSEFWTLPHNDASMGTGITMFDFNQDGKQEIVYRDEQTLRIIDGSSSIPSVLATIENRSGTSAEYPVVADVDGDGHAEITIVGGVTSDAGQVYWKGRLWVYKSAGTYNTWASARKVWNQYYYHPTQVNEDLSIPRYPISPATVFPGPDGIPGTSDDVRPYNNFWQQQTEISVNGTPLWLAPDAEFSGTAVFNYYAGGDSLLITVQVKNAGAAELQAPFYISAFKNTRTLANKIATDSCMTVINPGETKPVTVTVRNLSTYTFSKIVIGLNTKDGVTYSQAECKYDNNEEEYNEDALLRAQNDRAATITTTPVKTDVLKNDSIPSGCTPTLTIVNPLAKHGTASKVNDTVVYTAALDFVGLDTITYSIACNGNISTAQVIVLVHSKPANIQERDCAVPMPSFNFTIKQQMKNDGADHFSGAIAGDLDGDGIPEIAVPRYQNPAYRIVGIQIYDGATLDKKQYIPFNNNSYYEANTQTIVHAPIAMINTKGGDKRDLIICHPNGLIESFTCTDAGQNFTLTSQWTTQYPTSGNYANYKNYTPHVADFNADGIPELLVYNRIYNAATGALLLELEDITTAFVGRDPLAFIKGASTFRYIPVQAIADLDHDGILEIAAGSRVYKPIITNTAGTVNNTVKIINHPTLNKDGNTAIADINSDGILDIIFVGHRSSVSKEYDVYCWNLNNSYVISGTITSTATDARQIHGYLFIGDIDGIKDPGTGKYYPEICMTSMYLLSALKYDPSTNSLTSKWTLSTSDESGCTGITLYDFNNDGISELVYRDMTNIRVIDGRNPSPDLASFSCISATAFEMPVIVDAQGNGSACILATGYEGHITASLNYIYMFSSAGTPWSPARKVWNQSFYEPLLINEDLTAVKYPIPKTMTFGNPNRPMPYNNVLQQQTIMDITGMPFWLTPDAKFAEIPVFNYYSNGDSLVISTKLTNIGDAALNATFYVSAYKNDVVATNRMATDNSMVAINADAKDTVKVQVTIRKISTHTPLNKIILRINDKGSAAYIQQECDYDNNVLDFNPARLPKAANDTVAMLINTTVIAGVKFNDALPVCSPAVPIVAVNPSKGVAAIVNDSIKYTPATDFYGVDSLVYRLTCNSNDTTYNTDAKVYIIVSKPKSDTYIACKGEKTTAGFESITNVTYHWYKAETGGSPDGSAMDTRSCEAPGVWWVEARYKSKSVRPRLKVTIEEYPKLDLTGFSIGNVQTICYDNVPAQLKAAGSPSGGDGAYDYQWQQSADGVNGWTDVKDSTNTTLTPPALTSGTYYRLKVASCTTDSSNVVKIMVRSSSLYNYPDIRVSVCPDAGASINLSKYIDTLDVSSLSWESVAPHIPISSAIAGSISTGTISADDLNAYTRVYTLAYTVSNPCAANVKRKVYLETVKNGKIRPLRDSIVICHKYAEAIQVNQIFGIDARGTWSFAAYEADGVTPANIDAYIAESQSPAYNGAVIMNGKAIYENTAARKITVTYTPAAGSCVAGRSFTTKIVLTDN